MIIEWLRRLFINPRALLPNASAATITAIDPDDLPAAWHMLTGRRDRATFARDYNRLSYRDAQRRLEETMKRIKSKGGDVRGAYLAEAEDSQALRLPAHAIGLIKLYDEFAPHIEQYAPVQAVRKESGWLWIVLLLAKRAERKEPIVTPEAFTGETIPRQKKLTPEQVLGVMLEQPLPAARSFVPEQPTYPPPVEVKPELTPDELDPPTTGAPSLVMVDIPEPEPQAERTTAKLEITEPEIDDWLKEALDVSSTAPIIKLSEVIRYDNLAFIGAKGSGKTTLLLTAIKHRKGQVVALDPHASPTKWPCAVVGNGRKWGAIRKALNGFAAEMQKRFDAIGDGSKTEAFFKRPENRRTMVADEFRGIAKNVQPVRAVRERGAVVEEAQPGAGEILLDRLTEGRKAGECVLVACHNDTLDALGFPSGNADMKACFDWIIYGGGMAVERYARTKPKTEWLTQLQQMERPYVARHMERDQWYVLDFDLPPVLPPEDEDKSEIETVAPLPKPAPQLTPEQVVRAVAVKMGLTLPIPTERVDDPKLTPLLKIAATRGLPVRQIARLVFDAEHNSRFKQYRLTPRLEAFTSGNA